MVCRKAQEAMQHLPCEVSDRSTSHQGPAQPPSLHILGWLKSFLGSRCDPEVYHTAQPKKTFVLRQEIQVVPAGQRGHSHRQMLPDKCWVVPDPPPSPSQRKGQLARGDDGTADVLTVGSAHACCRALSFQKLWASPSRNGEGNERTLRKHLEKSPVTSMPTKGSSKATVTNRRLLIKGKPLLSHWESRARPWFW